MKANPGGQVAPNEVIGREELITNLWEILERQSLVLSAERRMGKTCVIKKMQAEAPQDKLPIYHDLEKVRSLRQMYPDVRMVFTGSIGLHHVVASWKKAGYTNEPTNDMYIEDVPPLSKIDATELARRLFLGEKIRTPDLQGTAAAIASAMDGIPFYIHHLIIKLKSRGGVVNAVDINEVINDCLIDPLNPWKMDHYRERIDNYYNEEQRPYALNILDTLAVTNQHSLFDDLFNRLKSEPETQNKEMARTVLRLLERDYYIIRKRDGAYRFRYQLIQLYWKLLRG